MPPLKGQLRHSYTEIPGLALYTAASRAHNKGTVIIRTGFRGPLYYPSTPGPAEGTLFSDPVQYTSACNTMLPQQESQTEAKYLLFTSVRGPSENSRRRVSLNAVLDVRRFFQGIDDQRLGQVRAFP